MELNIENSIRVIKQTMNYELAKQLKDAGFPQTSEWAYRERENREVNYHQQVPEEDDVRIPTLSELIKTYGDIYFELKHYADTWHSLAMLDDDSGTYIRGKGKTPEEAVAKLWLELNKLN